MSPQISGGGRRPRHGTNRFTFGDDDTFDRAVARFAEAYADRTEQDYAELIGAVDDGRVPIVRDL